MGLGLLDWQTPGIWLLFSMVGGLTLLLMRPLLSPTWQEALKMVRWLLLPYIGLLLGGLSPRLLGLTNLDWLASLGLGLGLVFALLLLLGLVRATTEPTAMPGLQSNLQPGPDSSTVTTTLYGLIHRGAQEFHWCFLRGALWEFIYRSPTPPSLIAYWAIWLAALLAAPEAIGGQSSAAHRLLALLTLLATSVLFLYTRNFWLCWLLHAAAWLIVNPQRETGYRIRDTG